MCDCGPDGSGAGPFATGKTLVEFVLAAHGGQVAFSPLPNGPMQINCQGCGQQFMLKTFVQVCPACGGVHAVSPPRASDPSAVQFGGPQFTIGQ